MAEASGADEHRGHDPTDRAREEIRAALAERPKPSGVSPALPRIAYSVDEAAEILGISDWKVRRLISAGRLPAKRLDGRILVSARALDTYFDDLPDAAD